MIVGFQGKGMAIAISISSRIEIAVNVVISNEAISYCGCSTVHWHNRVTRWNYLNVNCVGLPGSISNRPHGTSLWEFGYPCIVSGKHDAESETSLVDDV